MDAQKGRLLGGLVLVAGLMLCGLQGVGAEEASATQASAAEKQAESAVVRLPSQVIEARAFYPDGETPVSEASVKVWSRENAKFVWKDTADEEGRFELPLLVGGEYLLVLADRVIIPVRVDEEAPALKEQLDIFVPHGRGKFAEMPAEQQAAVLALFGGDDNDDKGGWFGETSPWVIGGLIGAAVAVPITLNEILEDDGGHRVVSPPF